MFQGFCEETIAFLWGIRFNNEKSWFEAHKPQYLQYVYQPMKALTEETFRALHQRFPDEELFCKCSRIYRDARRLYGRGPYKDHLWFCIRRPGDGWTEQPSFWMELAPEGYSYGMGFYSSRAFTMEQFRRELDDEPGRFLPLAKQFAQQDRFVLTGPEYARKKGSPGAELEPWYNRKHLSLTRENPYDELSFSPGLVDTLVEDFSALMPYYQYFDAFCHRMQK